MVETQAGARFEAQPALNSRHDSPSSLSESLWQAAYDHPVATGVAVGGTLALTGAALYLSRGRIAALLGHAKPGVLIVEDTPGIARAMKFVLEKQGHPVTWVTGIKRLEPLVGITPEGSELTFGARTLGSKLKVALVDGDLGKGSLTGPEIVGALRQQRVTSIGTSTLDSFNAAMRDNGAPITANKSVVFTSLANRQLDLKAAIKSPQTVQYGLDELRAHILEPENEPARHYAESLLREYMNSGV